MLGPMATEAMAGGMVELALSGIAAHSVRPLRAAIWLALAFAALGLLFVVYSIISFFFVQHTVAGWTSIMAAIAILGASIGSASAQDWPTRPIRLVVGASAGGGTDISARLIAHPPR